MLSCSSASKAGGMASSATRSACWAKVPGQNALRAAIQGRGRVLRSRLRAAALRRARPPSRREGLVVCLYCTVSERVFLTYAAFVYPDHVCLVLD